MLCPYPVTLSNGNMRPCKQCIACRINAKRALVGRIEREMLEHRNPSSFTTLTYADEHLPRGGSLDPRIHRHFLQRLDRLGAGRIRYFWVGEYGDRTHRPHYHAILFGLGGWQWQHTIEEAWQYGQVFHGQADAGAASYVAHYVTKKLVKEDLELDEPVFGRTHRHPEFARYTTRPVLGDAGLRRIVQGLMTKEGSWLVANRGFPSAWRHNGRCYPFTDVDKRLMMKYYGYEGSVHELPAGDDWDISPELATIFQKADLHGWSNAKIITEMEKLKRVEAKAEKLQRQEVARLRAEKWHRRRQDEVSRRAL